MTICPHCEVELTPEEVRSLWGSYTSSLATPHAGPGRPRWKEHCRCGAMTLDRAKLRNHVCPEPEPKKKAKKKKARR